MSTADDLIIEIDRHLAASPETVFRAITTPALVERWMGPEGSTCTVDTLELTLGGKLAFSVSLPDGGPTFRIYGFYEDIQPGRRLVHTWGDEGEELTSTVVWELEPVGDGTRLTLRHLGLTSPEEYEQNDGGWRHLLDRLEQVLTA